MKKIFFLIYATGNYRQSFTVYADYFEIENNVFIFYAKEETQLKNTHKTVACFPAANTAIHLIEENANINNILI